MTLFEQQIWQAGIDPAGHHIMAVCIGIRPEIGLYGHKEGFRAFTEKRFQIYQAVHEYYAEKALGFEVFCNEDHICMACFFTDQDGEHYAEKHIHPLLETLEKRYGLPLFAGVGITVDDPARFEEAFDSADHAYQTYYFNPSQVIVLDKGNHERRYSAIDEYFEGLEKAFRAILIHDPLAAEKIAGVLDILYDFHYGNRQAMIMHTMEYTGCIAMRLKQYRLLDLNFFEMQNSLQEQLNLTATYTELRETIFRHFEALLPQIYMNDKPKAKLVIEQVKDYTREHYMEDITVEKMAAFAHFSTDYFSHLFKKETGKTYKAFLTEIRITHAFELLRDTEFRIDEISEKVGYNNPRAFGEAFRQLSSVSPMEYRRVHRKK